MLRIRYHTSFKRDHKKFVKRGYNTKLLEAIILKAGKKGNNYQRKIEIIPLAESIADAENVILRRIGC